MDEKGQIALTKTSSLPKKQDEFSGFVLDKSIFNKVFEKDAFLEKVIEYARSFCPPGKAAKAVGNVKRAIQSGLEMSFGEGLALERELQAELFASDDAKEGLAAFVEKRNPVFKAR